MRPTVEAISRVGQTWLAAKRLAGCAMGNPASPRHLLRYTVYAVARAAAAPMMADIVISLSAGRPTLYTFPIAFPVILAGVLLADWWRSKTK